MEEVFCTERRKTPLKIGSVKSNVGHCEVSGMFVSIVKAIIILNSGYVPPNINYKELNTSIHALRTGKIQVCEFIINFFFLFDYYVLVV